MNLSDLILQYLEFQGNKPNVMVNVSDDECEDDLDRSKLRQVFFIVIRGNFDHFYFQRGGPSAQYVPHVVQRAYRKMMESGVMDDLVWRLKENFQENVYLKVHEQGWLSDDKLNDVHKCFPQASDSLKEELRVLKE